MATTQLATVQDAALNAKLNKLMTALARANTVQEVKAVVDLSEGLRLFAKKNGLDIHQQNECAKIRLRGERKGGLMVEAMPKHEGGRPRKTGNTVLPVSPETYEELGLTKMQVLRWRKVKDVPEDKFEPFLQEVDDRCEEITTVGLLRYAKGAHVSHNAGDNEWYTPEEYIEAARQTMGAIDLDPASSALANDIVKAKRFFGPDDNALGKQWRGRIWMNPPYASELIGKFSTKFLAERLANHITQACVLVNNATETRWFQNMAAICMAIMFPAGRVKFWHPDKVSAPLQGQAVLYFGDNVSEFAKHFEQFGVLFRQY